MCEVVAGVDDEVRLEGGKPAHPRGLSLLARGQVQVGQVQDAERLCARIEHRDGDPAQPVLVGLPHGVGDAGRLGGDGGGEKLFWHGTQKTV